MSQNFHRPYEVNVSKFINHNAFINIINNNNLLIMFNYNNKNKSKCTKKSINTYILF